jgi:hypothetical protein
MKKLIPFIGALVATIAFIGLGAGGLLPGGLRLQIPNGSTPASTTTGQTGHEGMAPAVSKPLVLVPPADGSKLALSIAPAAKPEQGYLVSVKVTSPAGKPVSEASIRFYDVVELFGQREELVGTGTTDGQGNALISYLPATLGSHQIVARFAGQGTLVPSLGVTTLDATVAAPAYKVDQPAFAAFAKYVPYGAGFLVLAVWGLIAFSLFATARGVVAGADRKIRKGETA